MVIVMKPGTSQEEIQKLVYQMEEQGMSSEQARIEAFYAIKEGRR